MRIKLLNHIIMFMLVSSTGGLLFVFNRNEAFFVLFCMLVASFFYIGRGIKKTVYYSSFLSFSIIIVLFAINFFFAPNSQSLTKYTFFGISIFTTTLTFIYFINQDDNMSFIKSLYFILKLILVHSLISFVAYFFINDNLFLITSEYHETLSYNLLFYYAPKEANVINFLGFDINRNSGIFWEAGILQIYLNILFFLEMSIFKKDKRILFLTIIAIVSTYSTTGLLLLIFQVIYFFQKDFKRGIAPLVILIVGLPLFLIFSANINEKLYGEGESSFQKRLFDLTQPVFIALENPLTGVGLDLDRFQEIREEFYINTDLNSFLNRIGIEQKVETTSKGSTNSVMYLLAGMGFPTTMLFLYMFIKQQVIIKDRFIWIIILFASVMSEPLLFRPFFFIFVISGFFNFFQKIINYKRELA